MDVACPWVFQVNAWTVLSHSTSGNREKMSRTIEKHQGVYLSSLLIHAITSPVTMAKPLLMASYCPLSGSVTQYANFAACRRIMSTLPSVDPPSTTTYSRLGSRCERTESIVSSRNAAWFSDGVTMEIFSDGGLMVRALATARVPGGNESPYSALGAVQPLHTSGLS